jgi:hypothetical protein
MVRRARRDVGVLDFVAFARRIARALGVRMNGATDEEFRAIVDLYQDFDAIFAEAMAAWVEKDAHLAPTQRMQTWAELGRMFGISRQAAEQRWSPAGRERKVRLQREYRARRADAGS